MNQTTHIPQTPNNRLVAIRKQLQMSQTDFANRMQMKQPYLSALEAGKNEVTAILLTRLIERFNVSADWMLTGKGQMFLVESVPARLALHEKCHPKPYQGFVRVIHPSTI
jgi:transcriptional regulator with XRE-family HTH domain